MIAALLALALLTQAAPQRDPREIIRKVVANQERNEKIADDYNYKERAVRRRLDGRGNVKKTEIKTFDVVFLEGTPWKRLIAKDDKPLSASDERKEQERLEKETRKRMAETPAERQKRLRRHDKEKKDEEEITREALEAFDFRLAGQETVHGVKCLVIEANPRPAYRPRKKEVELLKHLAGRIWVSEDSYDLVKFEATVIDTISFGVFLARLNKGARVMLEQVRVNDEVWLPRSFSAKLEARLAVLKKFNVEQENTYSDYKKFRVETTVKPIGESK